MIPAKILRTLRIRVERVQSHHGATEIVIDAPLGALAEMEQVKRGRLRTGDTVLVLRLVEKDGVILEEKS